MNPMRCTKVQSATLDLHNAELSRVIRPASNVGVFAPRRLPASHETSPLARQLRHAGGNGFSFHCGQKYNIDTKDNTLFQLANCSLPSGGRRALFLKRE